MSKETFVGGNSIEWVGGTYTEYLGKGTYTSGQKLYVTAVNTKNFSDNPEKPPVTEGNFIIDGEWLDKDGKPIDQTKMPHAKIGETVFFRVETKDIPEHTPILFELWEHDGIRVPTGFGTIIDTRAFDDYIPLETKETGNKSITVNVDKDGYATISVELTEVLEKQIEEDFGNKIELYFIVRYIGHDFAYLPRSSDNYLKVGYSDRTLFLQPAVANNKYGLPEFRTADGDILIFSGGVETGDNKLGNYPEEKNEDLIDRFNEKTKDEIKDKLKDKASDKAKDLLQKGRTAIAVHQLKMKKLAFNDGHVRQKQKLYSYKVFDNAGEEYIIQKASNYGFENHATKEIITSKGISQLDYFRETSIYSKIGKVGINALECLSFLDLAKYISGNGEQGQIPSPIPALDFVVGLMLEETKEQIKEVTNEVFEATLETAKDLGIRGVEEFVGTNTDTVGVNANDQSFSTRNIMKLGTRKYEVIETSQTILDDILTGKIRKLENLKKRVENQRKKDNDDFYNGINETYKSSLKYLIFYRWENDEKINNSVHIIETIFVR